MDINGLSIPVEQAMRPNSVTSALFVFGNRRRDCIKIPGWGGNGFWLLLKRFEADRFIWLSGGDTITLSAEQLHWLLDGIDLTVIQQHPQRYYTQMS
ncbi:IS66 family insertion sequence element accessory protein TnpB [Burkholderia anthina]|uniref:IS66 family insertion sequence element accessory protein TnpB n=1 Tax=Burkholderia anthina TaxID=179879 RepID=UPI001CF34D1F|nr:IS66 family insertion sequence element accessory protein TnpB [Burkholderia anthina]MCA8095234.1 IS66 family insertion sequence element accessory protein TnpB [Burkholderia anthina]